MESFLIGGSTVSLIVLAFLVVAIHKENKRLEKMARDHREKR